MLDHISKTEKNLQDEKFLLLEASSGQVLICYPVNMTKQLTNLLSNEHEQELINYQVNMNKYQFVIQ